MIAIDITIAVTALPKIHDTLGFPDAGQSWVQNAYTLALGGLFLLGGRSGDISGRRRMFITVLHSSPWHHPEPVLHHLLPG